MRLSRSKERDIRNALRREIRRQGLIDTGLLHDSIEIQANINDAGVLFIEVFAVDYINYLWEPYKLYNFIYKGDLISLAYMQWIDYMTKKNPAFGFLKKAERNARVVFELPEI